MISVMPYRCAAVRWLLVLSALLICGLVLCGCGGGSGSGDSCVDDDGDGYGAGSRCLGDDCLDSDNTCWFGACCPACLDSIDNDSDGWIDDADPDCAAGDDELGFGATECNDGADNDGDLLVDSQDPGCIDALDEEYCVPAGGSFSIVPGQPECCPGLESVGCDEPDGFGGCVMCAGGSYCTDCGDGVCGLGENACRCPADCP